MLSKPLETSNELDSTWLLGLNQVFFVDCSRIFKNAYFSGKLIFSKC